MSQLNEAVIIDAVRSPMGRGKPGGSLSSLHAVAIADLGRSTPSLAEFAEPTRFMTPRGSERAWPRRAVQ